jgi:outer membrane protein assembly factor BamA
LSPRAVLATRLETVLSTGDVPSYRQLELGGAGSLRGQPEGVVGGSNITRASLELRFPLLPQRRFRIPVPFVPEDIANVDLRIDGEVFVDAGLAWNNGADLPEQPVKFGTGVGLRVFLPILELLRLELAFDEDGYVTFYVREGNVI